MYLLKSSKRWQRMCKNDSKWIKMKLCFLRTVAMAIVCVNVLYTGCSSLKRHPENFYAVLLSAIENYTRRFRDDVWDWDTLYGWMKDVGTLYFNCTYRLGSYVLLLSSVTIWDTRFHFQTFHILERWRGQQQQKKQGKQFTWVGGDGGGSVLYHGCSSWLMKTFSTGETYCVTK